MMKRSYFLIAIPLFLSGCGEDKAGNDIFLEHEGDGFSIKLGAGPDFEEEALESMYFSVNDASDDDVKRELALINELGGFAKYEHLKESASDVKYLHMRKRFRVGVEDSISIDVGPEFQKRKKFESESVTAGDMLCDWFDICYDRFEEDVSNNMWVCPHRLGSDLTGKSITFHNGSLGADSSFTKIMIGDHGLPVQGETRLTGRKNPATARDDYCQTKMRNAFDFDNYEDYEGSDFTVGQFVPARFGGYSGRANLGLQLTRLNQDILVHNIESGVAYCNDNARIESSANIYRVSASYALEKDSLIPSSYSWYIKLMMKDDTAYGNAEPYIISMTSQNTSSSLVTDEDIRAAMDAKSAIKAACETFEPVPVPEFEPPETTYVKAEIENLNSPTSKGAPGWLVTSGSHLTESVWLSRQVQSASRF